MILTRDALKIGNIVICGVIVNVMDMMSSRDFSLKITPDIPMQKRPRTREIPPVG